MQRMCVAVLFGCLVALPSSGAARADWTPVEGSLLTSWSKELRPESALPEYPRPQLVRQAWQNLNGLWDLAITAAEATKPAAFETRILVPFAVESALSGVKKSVNETQRLWYRRMFEVPDDWRGQRVLLHFGAVDWETRVFVNGRELGLHRGGYDAFGFDITDALEPAGAQELVVSVWDPSDRSWQPRGKQVLHPRRIWYTPTSGIWQTVWLEPVPQAHIRSLRIVPNVDDSLATVTVETSAAGGVALEATRDGKTVARASGRSGQPLTVRLNEPRLWSPADPFLYQLKATLTTAGGTDVVRSYFGLRKIERRKDTSGVQRLFLNNRPLFQYGVLDQGFWPDSIYTAPTDAALRYDVEMARRLGFNMIRKHVKIEPQRWYYWCDTLGLLVWKDMPSGDRSIGGDEPDIERTPRSAENFERELKAMIDGLYNHPSIVMWVVYNEGWGQWDTARICERVRGWDETRLVNSASGWTDRSVGQVRDMHVYPGPAMPPLEQERTVVLGEFGGLGLAVVGHLWDRKKSWGYRSYRTSDALTDGYVDLLHRLRLLVGRGLSAAVYTQLSDVEVEVNGLLTYDRTLVKVNEQRAAEAAGKLHAPPVITTLDETAQTRPQVWSYTTQAPGDDWFLTTFDDSAWSRGPGGFGEPSTPGAVVGTTWKSSDIWIRRTMDLPELPSDVRLLIHHDEDAGVYLNGVLAAELKGYVKDYTIVPIAPEAAAALRAGTNLMAIHCHHKSGGQYIDAGLVAITWPEAE